MKLWKVEISTAGNSYGLLSTTKQRDCYAYTGTATTAEIATRQARRAAKKDGLSQIVIEKVECLGDKDFGK